MGLAPLGRSHQGRSDAYRDLLVSPALKASHDRHHTGTRSILRRLSFPYVQYIEGGAPCTVSPLPAPTRVAAFTQLAGGGGSWNRLTVVS